MKAALAWGAHYLMTTWENEVEEETEMIMGVAPVMVVDAADSASPAFDSAARAAGRAAVETTASVGLLEELLVLAGACCCCYFRCRSRQAFALE